MDLIGVLDRRGVQGGYPCEAWVRTFCKKWVSPLVQKGFPPGGLELDAELELQAVEVLPLEIGGEQVAGFGE